MDSTQEARRNRTRKEDLARLLMMTLAGVVLGWNAAMGLGALNEVVTIVRHSTKGTKPLPHASETRLLRTLGQYGQLDCIQGVVNRSVPPRTKVYVNIDNSSI